MRKAIGAALLAAMPAVCAGMQTAAQENAPPGQAPPVSGSQAEKETAAPPVAPAVDPTRMAGPAVVPGASTAAAADDKTFVIGPEDQLQIDVWADNRIGGPVLVRPDGRISLTLLGDVQAAGRTPAQLALDIGELLKQREILKRPQVNVKVIQVLSKKYMINGEVMKTGAFPLVVPTRIMDALVNAGGFKDFANKKDIVIIRGSQRLRFNWNEVVKGKKSEQNVFLEHGDIIIVK